MHDGAAVARSTTPPQPCIGAATMDPPRAPGVAGGGGTCGGGMPGRRRRQLGASAPASAAGPASGGAGAFGFGGFVGGGATRVAVGRWTRLAVAMAALLVVVRGAEAAVVSAPNEVGGISGGSSSRRGGLDGQARGRRAFLDWLSSSGGSSTSSSSGSGTTAATGATASAPGGDAAAVAGAVAAAAGGGAQGGSISESWLALLRLMNLPPDSLAHLDSLTVADIEASMAPAMPSTPHTLRVGVPLALDENVTLSLVEIRDSRCPVGALCALAGKATAVIEIGPANPERVELDVLDQEEIRGGYRLTCEAIEPKPTPEHENPSQAEYGVELQVQLPVQRMRGMTEGLLAWIKSNALARGYTFSQRAGTLRPATVIVSSFSKEVEVVFNDGLGGVVSPEEFQTYKTVEDLFVILSDAYLNNMPHIEATFDPTLGYPTKVIVDLSTFQPGTATLFYESYGLQIRGSRGEKTQPATVEEAAVRGVADVVDAAVASGEAQAANSELFKESILEAPDLFFEELLVETTARAAVVPEEGPTAPTATVQEAATVEAVAAAEARAAGGEEGAEDAGVVATEPVAERAPAADAPVAAVATDAPAAAEPAPEPVVEEDAAITTASAAAAPEPVSTEAEEPAAAAPEQVGIEAERKRTRRRQTRQQRRREQRKRRAQEGEGKW